MNPSFKKVDRLLQIEALLLAHPQGLTQAELARRLEVNRSTIGRYIPHLPKNIYIDDLDGGKWKIDRSAYLVQVRFNLHEATALHLASRLLANRLDKQNPHAAAALRKLGLALNKLAPHVSQHILTSADQMDDQHKRLDPNFISVLETLTLAWAEQKKVSLWHRNNDFDKVYQYTFSPYFVEPYAAGNSLHVIGYREPPGKVRTFKIERIEQAKLLNETYQIPVDFDPTVLLSQAWGIWYSEKEPVQVRLRFSQGVSRRVLENQWHIQEETELQPDGSLIWQASIAEPLEMLPWIRGWGADVEVLAPEGLRNTMLKEIGQLMVTYQLKQRPVYLKLWAKFNQETQDWHPLLWHMFDSAFVTERLWKHHLSGSFKNELADLLNLDVSAAGQLLSFWVGLHDIGKAGPAFQRKIEKKIKELQQDKINFPGIEKTDNAYHGIASCWILTRIFQESEFIDRIFGSQVALALGGHHGEWPASKYINDSPFKNYHIGDKTWLPLQNELVRQLKVVMNPPEKFSIPSDREDRNKLLTLLSGLTTTADWIASNETYFPYQLTICDSQKYAELSKKQAEFALKQIGWDGWKAENRPLSFEEIFPFQPNEIQKIVINATQDLISPFLLIIEAPTGSGKTEAALFVTDRILQTEEKAGFYIAMPTQATSNQMHSRTVDFLLKRYPEHQLNIHLVHGAALLRENEHTNNIHAVNQDSSEPTDHINAAAWFLPRKRTLLAPFGVGTVDQTFLSVMKSKHFFLRLFGLSHKVIVFDEVHAYDVYMNTLFKQLLHWLRVVGCSVIILSATLPEKTRNELLSAFYPGSEMQTQPDFPRLSIQSAQVQKTIGLGKPEDRRIILTWMNRDVDSIVLSLQDRLSEGGCAAVICNRVRRCQEIYQAVQNAMPDTEVIIFHSRFPYHIRKEIEEVVLDKFGKKGHRPRKAVVIATQVIEQSLDLDFDVMLSDLAPLDLLIQRVGRLQRHETKQDRSLRPARFNNHPELLLCKPEFTENIPNFDGDQFVYAAYILQRSYYALVTRTELILPSQTDELIKKVYDETQIDFIPPAILPVIEDAFQKMDHKMAESSLKAENQLIPAASQQLLGRFSVSLKDEFDPNTSSVLKVLTRDAPPSVQLVCIHKREGTYYLSDGFLEINFDEEPTYPIVQSCLRSMITVSNPAVTHYFFAQAVPPKWKKNKVLRTMYPLILENNQMHTEKFTLVLDHKTGVEIVRDKPKEEVL